MLILSRKLNESIVIDGRIIVKIVRVDGDVVKLGVAAPPDVPVHRQEVYQEILSNNQAALTRAGAPLPKLKPGQPKATTPRQFEKNGSGQHEPASRSA